MEGKPHLMDCEILEYESLSNINNSDISNDDDSDDDIISQPVPLPRSVNGRTFGRSMTPSIRTSTPTITTTKTATTNGHLKHRQNRLDLSEDDDDE